MNTFSPKPLHPWSITPSLWGNLVLEWLSQPWHYWHLDWVILCCGPFPVPCRMFSSNPGLYQKQLPTSCDNQKCLQTLLNVPGRVKSPQVENHLSEWTTIPFFLHMNLSLELLGLPHTQHGCRIPRWVTKEFSMSESLSSLCFYPVCSGPTGQSKSHDQAQRPSGMGQHKGMSTRSTRCLLQYTDFLDRMWVEEASRRTWHTFKDSRFRGWKEHLLCLHMITDNKHIVEYYFRRKY